MHKIVANKAIKRSILGHLILCGFLSLSGTIQAVTPAQQSDAMTSCPSEDHQKKVYKAPAEVSLPLGQLLIPANGQCLYTTIIMGYLLPVRQEVAKVTSRITKLFGDQSMGNLNTLRQTLQNPTDYLTYLHSDAFNTLVTAFMSRMQIKKGTWGGPQEIQTIANRLKVNIQAHYPDPSNPTNLVQSDLTKSAEAYAVSTIHIIRDRVHPAEVLTHTEKVSAKDNLHYQHYRLKYTLPSPLSVPLLSTTQLPTSNSIGSLEENSTKDHLAPFLKAARDGNSQLLAQLYHNDNISNRYRETALLYSAYSGHVACVKYLVQQGAGLFFQDKEGNTALLYSAHNGHLHCLQFLLQQGANIHHMNKAKNTALLYSAHNGHLPCLQFLLQQEADIYHKNKNENTALTLSACKGHFDCIKYLLQQGANIHDKNKAKNTALLYSAHNGYFDCLKYLVQQGANIYDRNARNNTGLLSSAYKGHLDCLQYLLQQGANLHHANLDRDTALTLSAQQGHLDCVKFLIQQGADLRWKGYDNKTALEWAKKKGQDNVVNYLSNLVKEEFFDNNVLQQWFEAAKTGDKKSLVTLYHNHHINVNISNMKGNTALLWSACTQKLSCVKFLIQQGADIHQKNKHGNTALLLSAYNGDLACLKFLVQQGAKLYDRNEDGNTATLYSAYSGDLDCIKFLLQQGADIDEKNYAGDSVLILSAYKGHLACVKHLVKQGANVTWKGQHKKTALEWAKKKEKNDVVNYLSSLPPKKQPNKVILKQWFEVAEHGKKNHLRSLYNSFNLNVNVRNEHRDTALLLGAYNGYLDCVKFLFQQGGNINASNEWDNTSLLLSVYSGHLPCVKYLLQQGADLHHKNENGNTALLYSASSGHLDCLKWLVQRGAHIHDKNENGNTALILSAYHGHLHCLQYLMSQGANIHDKDMWGNTALLYSASSGHLAVVKYLIQQGADLTWEGEEQKNALAWAKEKKQESVVNYLSNLSDDKNKMDID